VGPDAAPGLRLVANRGRPPGAGWRRPSTGGHEKRGPAQEERRRK